MYIAMTPELCNALTMDEAILAELDKLTELIINAIPVERIVNRDGIRIYG
jgi:BarA-like signal transduction histidine kinase